MARNQYPKHLEPSKLVDLPPHCQQQSHYNLLEMVETLFLLLEEFQQYLMVEPPSLALKQFPARHLWSNQHQRYHLQRHLHSEHQHPTHTIG